MRRRRGGNLLPVTTPVPESGHDLVIDLALERHDQFRQFGHLLPGPAVELGHVATGRRIDRDFAFVALEAEGEPFLGLAAILALEGDAEPSGGRS